MFIRQPYTLPVEGPQKLSNIFFVLTLILFFLSIALVRCMVMTVPIRTIYMLCLFFVIFALRPNLLIRAVLHMWAVLLVILYAALLGFTVSFFNGNAMPDIFRQLAEIHLQAIISLLIGYALLEYMGARKLVKAFVWIVGISCVIAVFQSLNINFAWGIRDALQKFQVYEAGNFYLNTRTRAMGLSFTPIHLATQTCLAFAAVFILGFVTRDERKPFSFHFRVALWVFLALLLMMVSGNRSPILGFLVFMMAYGFYIRPSVAMLASLFILPVFILLYLNLDSILEFLSTTNIRAFRIGDKSSEGREALRAYGMLLFLDRPFGYGMDFSSTDHVSKFWAQLAGYENAETVWGNAVHNCYINILLKYGVLIFPLPLLVLYKLIKNKHILLAFLPYIVHIYYHNDGPLQADFLIWFFLPMVMFSGHVNKFTIEDTGRTSRKPLSQTEAHLQPL